MKAVSAKRLGQLREYTPQRKAYLLAHRLCAVCKERRSAEVHHTRGREGKLLLAEEFWLAVCWTCHRKIHENPKWAKEAGYRN